MARPTDERKGHNQIFRVSDEMREWLQSQAKAEDKTVSDYLREMVSYAMQNKLCNAKPDNSALQNSNEDSSALQNEIERLTAENEQLRDRADWFAEQYELSQTEVATLEQQIVEQGSSEEVPAIVVKCSKESRQILSFLEKDFDYFWNDLYEKITTADLTSGVLTLGESLVARTARKEEIAKIIENTDKITRKELAPQEKVYEEALSIGFKAAYNKVKNGEIV